MQRFELVEVSGHIVGRPGVALFQVKLPNGHLVVAHLSPEAASCFPSGGVGSKAGSDVPDVATEFSEKVAVDGNDDLIGTKVLIRLRAFDLSSGSIISFGSVEQVDDGPLEVGRSVIDK